MKSFFVFAMVLLFVSGCGFNEPTQEGSFQQDENGTKLMTNANQPVREKKDIDYSTQNPNVDITNSPLNTREDQQQIEQVLAMEKGYWLGSMWTNGKDAWVTVYTSNDLSKRDLKKQEQKLHDKMQAALPRFDLRVKLKRKN
ncbi:hypothetical protein [Bacillus kexueae]|uniref:hypothetical protein n=1 Tax=Aeribacillus kexueae TaxID=2078952 RepID=UPI001FAF6973|nr:hypothetical protein [Bacillus kexueae]